MPSPVNATWYEQHYQGGGRSSCYLGLYPAYAAPVGLHRELGRFSECARRRRQYPQWSESGHLVTLSTCFLLNPLQFVAGGPKDQRIKHTDDRKNGFMQPREGVSIAERGGRGPSEIRDNDNISNSRQLVGFTDFAAHFQNQRRATATIQAAYNERLSIDVQGPEFPLDAGSGAARCVPSDPRDRDP
jgi:hypothetical protein